MTPRPRIWIDPELAAPPENGKAPSATLSVRYADAIWKAGGLPLIVPPLEDEAFSDELLDQADGLVFSGGDDFDTERLGLGPTHPSAKPVLPEKQDFDVRLARAALARDLPILGICYGMQLLGLVDGGELHQHLPDDVPDAREHRGGVEHAVGVETESKLGRALGVPSLSVVSRHHQALATVGGAWRVVGRDEEGLIEAIEHTTATFAVGVQWHPELASVGDVNGRIFEAFVASIQAQTQEPACRRAEQREGAAL